MTGEPSPPPSSIPSPTSSRKKSSEKEDVEIGGLSEVNKVVGLEYTERPGQLSLTLIVCLIDQVESQDSRLSGRQWE